MRGGAAIEDERAGSRSDCWNGNLAASALPLIVLPDISPRIVTGRKGMIHHLRQTKKATPKRRLFHFVP
ncbi:hypothetical protein CK230_08680 [Mesorhizobium sp. WSM3859]|nr:hypothetical protein CK230_08680 [Mesorhizobium sp. WSM3859]